MAAGCMKKKLSAKIADKNNLFMMVPYLVSDSVAAGSGVSVLSFTCQTSSISLSAAFSAAAAGK
jgi:hypothetical protein